MILLIKLLSYLSEKLKLLFVKKIFILLLLSVIGFNSNAQELFCDVQVTSKQVSGTDKQIYETLQNAIYEFMNNRKWTNYAFEINERIECTMVITITNRSSNVFSANLNLVLRRPVYNTNYNSVLLNYVDKDFQFEYIEYQPLDYSDNSFTSNLTSVLAFYSYVFLGMEFDSYTLYGGTPFYEKAEAVVSNAQNVPQSGWKSHEDTRNRYWIIENLQNAAYKPLRRFYYMYHLKGLDAMYDNVEKGRSTITQSLDLLETVYEERPGLFFLKLITDAKRDEFVNIFKEGLVKEKSKAVEILKNIDPANTSKYQEITRN